MGLENRYSVYPFAEMIQVLSEGDTIIDVLSIPAGTLIEHVGVIIKTPAVGASNLIVGDDDDDNGFITAADAVAAANTVYGDDPTERGAYLYDATKKGAFRKYYTAAKTLKFVLSADPATSEGVYQVIVVGKRFAIP